MKNLSIKKKVTLWYTGIVIIVLLVAFLGAFFASEIYSTENLQEELKDEVNDLVEDINYYPDYFPDIDLTTYYDDGVMLGIYESDGSLINGISPDDFPIDYKFQNDTVQTLKYNDSYWYIYDREVKIEDDNYWIRGVHSYSSIALIVNRLLRWILIMFPTLVFLTAYIGYKMVNKAFIPVKEMTDTANEITASNNLSLRLPIMNDKDELGYLSNTFNTMIEHIDNQFTREKEFASDAAHELRTPISVMMAHCEYLLKDLDLNEKQKNEVNIIYEKTKHMSNLVDALLVISRMEKTNYQINKDEIDISSLAEIIVDEMREEAKDKNITLSLTNHLENNELIGDMTLLVQLFTNLISNSIKYGKENGFTNILLREENDNIHIHFEDNGIGIEKDKIDKIFNRFYQANESHSDSKSFGLGLFMVKRIIELHKGTIEVASTVNKGTIFIVTLPKNIK